MKPLLVPLCVLASCLPAFAKAPPAAAAEGSEEFTRLQIFLDNANFGPGKIDGHDGDFTRRALVLYRRAKGLPETEPALPDHKDKEKNKAKAKDKPAPDTSGLDLASIDPVITDYTVTKEDAATVGELPTGPAAQAKVKRLPYATLAEALAEKFHCDVDYFKQLNKEHADKLKEGDKVRVPNVKPFELAAVKDLQPGSEVKELATNEADNAEPPPADANPAEEKKDAPTKPAEPKITIQVSTTESMLEVKADDKLVAAFPVTIGSSETASPLGDWKVRAVAKLPDYRYDKKMLQEGERSADFKILPPGPNNPVGVMWIALNKKGIGLHGTNDPDSIGRAASHGCIRLANWDVVKVAELVKAGVPVSIH